MTIITFIITLTSGNTDKTRENRRNKSKEKEEEKTVKKK